MRRQVTQTMDVSFWPDRWGRSSKSEAPKVNSFQLVYPMPKDTNCVLLE